MTISSNKHSSPILWKQATTVGLVTVALTTACLHKKTGHVARPLIVSFGANIGTGLAMYKFYPYPPPAYFLPTLPR